MADILITTPAPLAEQAAEEAYEIWLAGGGSYFRRLAKRPARLNPGDRCFYTERGFIRGFATVTSIEYALYKTCDTTCKDYEPGWYVTMDATTWNWVAPIPYPGFQGFRYMPELSIEIVGGWKDPMPLNP
jgi:hypothetical protein